MKSILSRLKENSSADLDEPKDHAGLATRSGNSRLKGCTGIKFQK